MNQHLIAEIRFNLEKWEATFSDPLWYMSVMPELMELLQIELDEETKSASRELIYSFFEDELYSDKIKIASSGPDFDQWREKIDTIVIHYTGNRNGVSWKRLSTIGFLRQYAQDFWRSDDVYGISTRGTAIWSNHFRQVDGKNIPVFYAYHWIVRADGSYERLLNDEEIGWQAGNKEINFRSVGIVLDGDFVNSEPPIEMIDGIRKLIAEKYDHVSKESIFGHCEVNSKTVCPGNLFLEGWKAKIV